MLDFKSLFRITMLPFLLLLGAGLLVFLGSIGADPGSGGLRAAWELLQNPEPASAQNTLSSAGEVVAAVLAIAITVVAIIVELASNRYTHRITELFVGAPANFLVVGFFVVTAVQGLWVNLLIDPTGGEDSLVPYLAIRATMVMLTLSLLILLPYFAYVFHFLSPLNIVDRIRKSTIAQIRLYGGGRNLERAQAEAVRGVEQLQDIALNAMQNKDKGVSMAAVEAMESLVEDYQGLRDGLHPSWFAIDGRLAHNPDLISLAPSVLDQLRERRCWFEWKVLRAYQSLYNEALNKMRDINYVVAINTRLIASAAWKSKNLYLLDMVVKFFNTYLRSTINNRDVRTAYNVLNQYRQLAQTAVDEEASGDLSVRIGGYFKYYGQQAYDAQMPFILETVAYDMCSMVEHAFDRQSPALQPLLDSVLQVDKESISEAQEMSLKGVRKAQLKLATYFLLKEDERLARQVFQDMEMEQPQRLATIRDELMAVVSPEFWEVSDRGVNFDYLDPDRKRMLLKFFDWFGALLPPHPSPSLGPLEFSEPVISAAPAGRGQRNSLLPMPPGRKAEDGPASLFPEAPSPEQGHSLLPMPPSKGS